MVAKRTVAASVAAAVMMAASVAIAKPAAAPSPAQPAATATPAALVALFNDWRAAAAHERTDGVVDFSEAALARKAAVLAAMRARLAALDRTGWTARDIADARLIEAEMNGLDFDLRVRWPWARDPSYFATVFGEQSDVPAHEGPSADTIDLFDYDYPLTAPKAAELAQRLRGVPVLLARARGYLAAGNAADLWKYGPRAFNEQAGVLDALIAGTLKMRTLAGSKPANLSGAGASVRAAAIAARDATRAFATWIAAEAPKKTGPSGIGKDNYNWYMAHVQLVPYDWDAQHTLLTRELERAWSALALEEWRNRDLPPLKPIEDPAAYRDFAARKMDAFVDFIISHGFVADKPWYRAAMKAQALDYTAPEKRNFFLNVTALDPWPLYSHDIHWTELARLREEPNASPIRRVAPLFNIYAARSEGYATAFEEVVMRAGLYNDVPRGRELVWIMLANRAARGLASLEVQANRMTLAEAGQFHSRWTPRGWADPNSDLVGFEQLLYLRQPGYGSSYIVGKELLDRYIARHAHGAAANGQPADIAAIFKGVADEGIVPWPLMDGME